MKIECKADEFVLLKRLDNGQYMNLTDLDFETAKGAALFNNEMYTPDIDGKYILMFSPAEIATNFYVEINNLEQLLPYAPSVKKVKRISIADVIMAKLMVENTSLRYTVECDDKDTSKNNKITMFLKISRENNTRQDVENITVFEEAYAEDF